MFDLTGRAALVTGASGGIGAAIARALHGAGATVALSGTRAAALEEVRAALGERAFVTPADLSQPDAADALVKQAEQAMGAIDILVNNAGLNRDMLLMRLTDKDWQAVMEVDLFAAFRLSRSALRGMVKRRWGRIVGIGSVVGTIGNAGQANYAAAKAGLIGMSKSLAYEVATRNITVNVVSPGFIKTAMTDKLNDEQRAKITARIPADRLGEPRDVAACVVFLASEEAGYVTGQTLHVNGGMAMI
ncbi:MAG: 3-oxoacyl-[acyl-carrier-protein] reductase [Alphaproteobacteria bacterium]|nr:3-oxoacyl-[acyl-carrier-protein] reductase [Alphaproteobacteria bacterium]